ncbi:MAG: sodium-dependent transporter [Rhodothermales bacterium]
MPETQPNASADGGDSNARGTWNSKLGFILAASGSAIGLGNIVFFSSNAYQFGGGAFYLPYFIALFVLGIPVMILEFGIGSMTQRSFPEALYRLAGRRGEFVGWWSIASALFITMYYVTIVGWAMGMMFGSFGSLFESGATAPFSGLTDPTSGPSAQVWFFDMIATWWPLLCVIVLWTLNIFILWRGTSTIEKAVRVFVPMMWIFMILLIVRGLTLPGGWDGVLYLFSPDLDGILDVGVWKGAFSQMFFSLSLGLGTMTAYASYLPKDADQTNNSLVVAFMNCGFEYIAGVAIFSLLFAFSLAPSSTSTLVLSFFLVPQGIADFPFWVKGFGFFFFFLVVIAGLTSSISLIESPASALIDKLGISRPKALAMILVPGMIGSICFALPMVIDPALAGNGTLGLSLLDAMDHWAFNYSLLTVGCLECLFVGWVLGADKLRMAINYHSKFKIGVWFDVLIKYVIPLLLGLVIISNLIGEFVDFSDFSARPLFGTGVDLGGFGWIPYAMPLLWLFGTLALASYLTFGRSYPDRPIDPLPFREPTSSTSTDA